MTVGDIIMMLVTLYLVFCMIAVLWFDVTRYMIPNWLVGSLLLVYPVAVLLAPKAVDWQMALVAMLAVFAVGYVIFAMKWMGGGDIKLITVCALWVGLDHLTDFIFLFAIIGGVFSVLILVARKFLPLVPQLAGRAFPRILRDNEPIPYGVAIALGFMAMFLTDKIPVLSLR
jgi:prepilin peptidase CpaA